MRAERVQFHEPARLRLSGAAESDYADAISLEQKKLSELIDQTIFAVSTNESRPVYMGSLFELEGDRLTVVAVDGYRLALRREEVSGKVQSARFIVPGSVLQDVSRLCGKGEEQAMIDLGERHVSFSIGDTVIISRLLEGDFLNYRKTVPENFKYKLKAERAALLSATDRVSLVVDETVKSPIRSASATGASTSAAPPPSARRATSAPARGTAATPR